MSLFQTREWWSTHAGADESFGAGALVVGNVDNSQPAADKIAVGSLSGLLRIYQPSQQEFKIEDLVHEEDLGAPILQLSLGRLIPGCPGRLALAVLHPRKVSVFECVPQAISKGRAAYFVLENLYTHSLGTDDGTFTAFNMICAPFGGRQTRDSLCVQCMDGKLQLFEQDAHAFSRVLSNTLLPGPLVYSKSLDALVSVNSSRQAICCKYQALAAAQDEDNSGKLVKIRRAIMEWETNIGEYALDAVYCDHVIPQTSVRSSTIVLGEHTLFAISDQGGVVAQRRLDCSVSCISSFTLPDGSSNLLLATHDGMLQVFRAFDLVWAAKLRFVPVSIKVGTVAGNPGMLVCVGEDGDLAVMYLGTQASATVAAPKTRDIDFAEVDKEYRQLSHAIKSIQNQTRAAPSHTLVLRAQIPSVLDPRPHGGVNQDPSNYPTDAVFVGPHRRVCALSTRLYVMYTGRESIKNVQITTDAHDAFVAVPSEITYDVIHGTANTPLILPITVYAKNIAVPSSRRITFQATYFTESGEPRVSRAEFQLPLCSCLTLHQPSKSGAFKLTLDTNVPACSMVELFGDVVKAAQELDINVSEFAGTHAIGFRFWPQLDHSQNESGPATVTILVSKTGGRYRVQSNYLPALSFVIQELQARLTARFKTDDENQEGLIISFDDSLPLGDLHAIMDEHHKLRQQLIDEQSKLNDNAHQFRVIEKRLLVRMKDRTYLPMAGLEILMHETYKSILQTSDKISQLQARMKTKTYELHSAVRLVMLMMRFMFGLEEEEASLLEAYLFVTPTSCTGEGNGGHGWEELSYLSTMYLLKTALAKNQRHHATLPQNVELLDDIEKLKRHIAIVCDRVSKGARLRPALQEQEEPIRK